MSSTLGRTSRVYAFFWLTFFLWAVIPWGAQ